MKMMRKMNVMSRGTMAETAASLPLAEIMMELIYSEAEGSESGAAAMATAVKAWMGTEMAWGSLCMGRLKLKARTFPLN